LLFTPTFITLKCFFFTPKNDKNGGKKQKIGGKNWWKKIGGNNNNNPNLIIILQIFPVAPYGMVHTVSIYKIQILTHDRINLI